MAAVLAAVLLLGACGSSKSSSDDATAASSNEKPSESTASTPSTADASAMTPEFSKGLAVLWSDANGTSVAVLPAGLDSCVYVKLPASDIAAISAMKVPADSTGIQDALGIRSFQASSSCDHDGVVAMFSGQLGLDHFGITPTDVENQCVASSVLDGVVALDASTATGSSGEALKVPFANALQSCVPIKDFLAASVAKEGLSPDVAACVADKASQNITWLEIINDDPSLKAEGEAAGRACAGVTSN